MRKITSLFLATALMVASAATPALAERNHWHDHDIHRFHEHDYARWRSGRWVHGPHQGREGWWWTINGNWYFYRAPVYPFPDPYIPSVIYTEPVPAAPVPAAPNFVYYCPDPAGYYPYVIDCYNAWQRMPSTVVVTPGPQPAPPLRIVTTDVAREAATQSPEPLIAEAPPQQLPPQLPHVTGLVKITLDGSRENDDRQLNAYAVEFHNIDLRRPQARATLKKLERKVENFRQLLYTRSYPAMDIVRDADALEHRIAMQREKLGK